MSQHSGGPPQPRPAPSANLDHVRTLLAALIVLQVAGWIGLVLMLKPSAFPRRLPERKVEVVRSYGAPDVRGPEHLVVTSETRVYVNGERVAYRPEDETDAVEYAANLLAGDRGAAIIIQRTIKVRAGEVGWAR